MAQIALVRAVKCSATTDGRTAGTAERQIDNFVRNAVGISYRSAVIKCPKATQTNNL
jgi:hypothetical protein